MRYINYVRNISKWDVVVTLDEHHLFCARFEDIREAALQVFPSCIFLVDLQAWSLSRAAID